MSTHQSSRGGITVTIEDGALDALDRCTCEPHHGLEPDCPIHGGEG